MKKGVSERILTLRDLSLKDIRLQVIIGIILVLLVLVLGFVSINTSVNNIIEACSNTNSVSVDGSLNALSPISPGENSGSCKYLLQKCTEFGENGLCCYPQRGNKGLYCARGSTTDCPGAGKSKKSPVDDDLSCDGKTKLDKCGFDGVCCPKTEDPLFLYCREGYDTCY
jgi:hypothetical protein